MYHFWVRVFNKTHFSAWCPGSWNLVAYLSYRVTLTAGVLISDITLDAHFMLIWWVFCFCSIWRRQISFVLHQFGRCTIFSFRCPWLMASDLTCCVFCKLWRLGECLDETWKQCDVRAHWWYRRQCTHRSTIIICQLFVELFKACLGQGRFCSNNDLGHKGNHLEMGISTLCSQKNTTLRRKGNSYVVMAVIGGKGEQYYW